MNIKIKEKLEQINNQSEHIRMRYVWGCVAVSMFVIFIVWIFSIVSMFTNNQVAPLDNSNVADIQKQFQDLKEQTPSLKSLSDQSVDALNEGAAIQQNPAGAVSSSQENSTSEIPQSDSYSKLPNSSTGTSTQQ